MSKHVVGIGSAILLLAMAGGGYYFKRYRPPRFEPPRVELDMDEIIRRVASAEVDGDKEAAHVWRAVMERRKTAKDEAASRKRREELDNALKELR